MHGLDGIWLLRSPSVLEQPTNTGLFHCHVGTQALAPVAQNEISSTGPIGSIHIRDSMGTISERNRSIFSVLNDQHASSSLAKWHLYDLYGCGKPPNLLHHHFLWRLPYLDVFPMFQDTTKPLSVADIPLHPILSIIVSFKGLNLPFLHQPGQTFAPWKLPLIGCAAPPPFPNKLMYERNLFFSLITSHLKSSKSLRFLSHSIWV
jgi:hypothetical protein